MLMYNGVSYGLYKNCFNVIEDNNYGFIKLADSNNDNMYDVVQYTDYVNEKVKLADETTGILQTASFRIDLNDIDIACRIYKNGLEVNLAEIQKEDMLSISKSKNTDGLVCYEIYIAAEKIDNVVLNSYDSKEREIKAGDNTYKLASSIASPGIDNNIMTGKSVELLLDGFGKVCQISLTNSEDLWAYAYLINIYEDIPDKGMLQMVGLDTERQEIQCDFPVSVDNGYQKTSYKSTSDLRERILNDNNGEIEQLIRYRLNSDGKIKRIETASKGANVSKFSLDYKSSSASYKWAVNEWDYAYKVDSNTKYLIVPDNVRDFDKYRTTPILNGSDSYNIEIYDSNDRRVASVVVIYGYSGSYISDFDKNLFLVTDTMIGLNNDDESVKVLEGYKQGTEISFYEPYENAFEDINVGDTMYVVLDDRGEVFRFRKISPENPDTASNDESCNHFTTVEDINYTEVKDSWRWYDLSKIPVYIVDRRRNKVLEGSVGDIEIGDEILISIRSYEINLAVVYKDML